ncbi:K02A2.6-like [Cordylochernes scorpioides]|uniref:RNA-directed DNA polymerase n=1 Tax=Cordylochernes scorpioides TaxID=51811 RepID=A0ABY6LBZ4_9ARAC|nr:K02A2.6-like [Cordylochernes scorpioides]
MKYYGDRTGVTLMYCSMAYWLKVITALLIIGCVELNPGPKRQTTLTNLPHSTPDQAPVDDLKLLIINLSAEVKRLGEKIDARLLNIEQKMEDWDRRMTGIEISIALCTDALTTNTRSKKENQWLAINQLKTVNNTQNAFFRRLLDLPSFTPGYILRRECGRISTELNAVKLTLKFWVRILKMETSRLPHACLNYLWKVTAKKEIENSFTQNLIKILDSKIQHLNGMQTRLFQEIDLGKVAIQHKIITKSEQPISLRPYRRPLKEYDEIAEQVKELLEHKLIRTSDSPWAFPVVMVPKKDGNKRMCIDYRRLNEITLDDRQPLPHIQDMFDRLHGSRFFSTLDVAWGYWQIEMDPQSIQKTAFVTNDGHYEFLVMPFGLKNAASTFQRIIQHILGELLWKGTCSFQDDILVYTKTWQEHIELLIKYLGHIISHNQLKPDPGKVKSIQDFPRPDNVKKFRQFMGLANYYRKFVKDFSKISFPLVLLTRKNQPFIWNEEVEESFAKLKMALSTKPVLAIYNPDYPSKVYTDASKYGIGAILTQIGPDNEEHVIAYYSKTLQPHQENYSAYEMEFLAVIQATDHFHVYIENQPFEIITDHAALQWLFTMKKPKPKYFRWILSLSSKSCNIVHRSGKQQTHVDALSRLPVVNIATQELQEHQQNSDLSFLKNSHTHDGVVMIKQKGVFKAVVPNSLTKKILEEYHDSLSHPSITKTCKLITQCYWWKGITTDIKNYVRSCKSCQLVKVRHEPTLGEMITPTSNIQPLQMIDCDTIVLGTAAANTKHKFIQVFVDHATRYLWAYPTITNTAQAVTQCLDKIIKSVNSINTILTDNGKIFISKEFNKFLSLQGIKHTYTSPYHPQCNGICEKLNDTIMTKLRIAVLETPRCKWSSLLPQVVKNYNSTPHDVTGFSPLFLMYGIGNVPEFADQTPITIEEARQKASLRTEQFRSKWKIKHDSHHPKYVFKEGDLVIRKIAFNDPRLIKTSPKYEGPFVIQKNISDVTYDISLKDQKQARRVHISQLRPFITRE